jgi:hypothetical protein
MPHAPKHKFKELICHRADVVASPDMPTSFQEWRMAQRQDMQSTRIRQLVTEGDPATLRKGFFLTIEGVLMRTTKTGNQVVWVPIALRQAIMKTHHDHPLSGHLGILKNTASLSQNYSWKGMKEDVRNYIKGCDTCQRIKPSNIGPQGFMDSKLAPAPGVSASCDLIGPLPRSSAGFELALVIIDDFTKLFEIYPLRKATARAVADKLVDYCCRYGFMCNLRSDRGPQFASHTWVTVCEKLGILPRKIVAYRLQGNPTERTNRTIKECIKSYAEEHRDWDKNLSSIAIALRTSPNETTKYSPAMLTFGHELRSPFTLPQNEPEEGYETDTPETHEFATKLKQKMAMTIAIVQENCRLAHARQTRYYNQGRRPADLQVGDWVMRRTHVLSDAAKGITSSLSPLYEGPFRISRKIGNNVSELENEDGDFVCTRNVDQLRRYHDPPPWAREDGEVERCSESIEDEEPILDEGNNTTQGGAVLPPQPLAESRGADRPPRARNIPARLRDYVMATHELPFC